MLRFGLWLTLGMLAVNGCVGKKKYTALETEYNTTKTELGKKLDSEVARAVSLEEALEAEKQKRAELLNDKDKLNASIAEMELALRDLQARKAAADARIAEYRDFLNKFKAMIDAGKLKVKIVDGRMVVELASDILFASGSAALSPEGKTALTDVAAVLGTIQDRSFQIEGHTDNDPIKTDRFPSNWELGAGRAITVLQTLKDGGVNPSRLSAASFSDNRPVAENKTPEAKKANRRIEIVVVPDLSSLPGYDELEKLAAQ